MSILDNIRAGLDRGELFLEYLPTMDLARRCVRRRGSAGALATRRSRSWPRASSCRWSRTRRSRARSPTGSSTLWLQSCGAWLGANPDAQIGINVPAEILGRGGLEYAARRSGLNARVGQIVLEITEHGIPDRLGLTALQFMAERGVRIALDDIMLSGTNLALLTRCNFSMVKLSAELTGELRLGRPAPEWLDGLRVPPAELFADGGRRRCGNRLSSAFAACRRRAVRAGLSLFDAAAFARDVRLPCCPSRAPWRSYRRAQLSAPPRPLERTAAGANILCGNPTLTRRWRGTP